MRITFLGHVGMFVETAHGSVLCDPWFTPAYFGSWFPFPRNDRLDVTPFERPDYLYLSHLHRDHFDPAWLSAHVDRSARVLLPDFEVPYLEQELRQLGFSEFIRCPDGEVVGLDGLEVAILAQNDPADGPLGDSAIVIGDGAVRILNQNDARPGDAASIQDLGPFDAQFVQFSGAIWYPVAYSFPPEEMDRLGRLKRSNQMERALNYVRWADAAAVFPCAGPPAFLDPDLFHLNDLDGDPANIFPDQPVFLELLREHGIDTGHLIVPGSVVELSPGSCEVSHPDDRAVSEPFEDKRAYLERYAADWSGWLDAERSGWSDAPVDLVAELADWFGPLLQAAPLTRAGIGGVVVLDVGGDQAGDGSVAIDFVNGEVREWTGEPYVYRVEVDRRLVEACVRDHTEDWVNSLFLSARFTAHRTGGFNEYVMTFFKSLSPERMAFVEQIYAQASGEPDEWFERDGWRIQRYCPHRQGDLVVCGRIEDGQITCLLHHWTFDLESGDCTAGNQRGQDVRLEAERLGG